MTKCSICGDEKTMTAWGESCKCSRKRDREWRKQLKMNKMMRKAIGMKW